MIAPFHRHSGAARRTRAASARAALVVALVATTVVILGPASMAGADGDETLGPPKITIAKGSGVATAGTGMHTQPAAMTVTVPAGATVKQVLLYWEGHYTTGEPDSTIVVEGTTVQGTLIGGPRLFFEDKFAATYRADITSLNLVSAGANTLDVSGLQFSFRNNGAGVLVIYDNGTEAVIDIRDGQDLAYFEFAPPLDTTTPQTFTFAASPAPREASLDLFAASVADGVDRPNALDVTIAGSTTRFTDVFSSNVGPEFDVVRRTITVPAGVTQLTVQALSVGDGTANKPASFDWIGIALSLQPPPGGPTPGASATLACPDGVARITLTNTGGTATTFDVFRGQEKLNAQPIAVNPGANATFTYQLRPADENTTVPLRAVAATGAAFDLATPVDCSQAGLVAALAEDCATQNGVQGILVRLTNEGTDSGTFTVPGRDPVTVGPKSSTDVFLAVSEGAAYSFEITGAGGFRRTIAGTRDCQAPQLAPLQLCVQDGSGVLVAVTNSGEEAVPVTLGGETRTAPAGGRAEFFVKRSEDDPATTLTATSPGNGPLQVALPVHDCVGVLSQVLETTTTTAAPTTTIPPQVAGVQLARTGFGFGTVLRIGFVLLAVGALVVLGARRRRVTEG
jgi:hypothetical protein